MKLSFENHVEARATANQVMFRYIESRFIIATSGFFPLTSTSPQCPEVNGSRFRRQRSHPPKKGFVLIKPTETPIFLACFELICIDKQCNRRYILIHEKCRATAMILFILCFIVLMLSSWSWACVTSFMLHLLIRVRIVDVAI